MIIVVVVVVACERLAATNNNVLRRSRVCIYARLVQKSWFKFTPNAGRCLVYFEYLSIRLDLTIDDRRWRRRDLASSSKWKEQAASWRGRRRQGSITHQSSELASRSEKPANRYQSPTLAIKTTTTMDPELQVATNNRTLTLRNKPGAQIDFCCLDYRRSCSSFWAPSTMVQISVQETNRPSSLLLDLMNGWMKAKEESETRIIDDSITVIIALPFWHPVHELLDR